MVTRKRESGYTDVDGATDPSEYVRRLDYVGNLDFWRQIKFRTYALLDLHTGHRVLDVGCGTGDDARALASIVGQTGRVIGVDASATMIEEARRRSATYKTPVQFFQGDVCNLPFEAGSFDACRAERLLQHLHDPHRAVSEMVRVVKNGGMVVAVEPDYGAAVITGAEPDVTRRILQQRCEHFRSGRIGRTLPQLFQQSGLHPISVTLATLTTAVFDDQHEKDLVRRQAEEAQSAGVVTGPGVESWLDALSDAAQLGRYRHAVPVFVAAGRKA